jgi:ribose 5-phosphate isomerase B
MKIALGNDHIGLSLVKELDDYFKIKKINIKHFGTFKTDRMNYPEIAFSVSEAIANKEYDQGILVCGTGLGMSLAANQIKGIRAVVCNDPYSAKMAKSHNNSNIICFGSRIIGIEMAKMILDNWFKTSFEGGRHNIRVEMINNYNNLK